MKYNKLKERVKVLWTDDHSVVDVIEILCDETENQELFDHMEHVATLASDIATHHGLDEEEAYLTGILHDVGRLVDSDEYLHILKENNIAVTEQEKKVVDVLHCKVATLICDEVFKIDTSDIHLGVLYHTTLRREPTDFEKVIFLADKMTWEYDELVFDIEETVFQSLNVACYKALNWLLDHIKHKNGLLLEDTTSAYEFFKSKMLL